MHIITRNPIRYSLRVHERQRPRKLDFYYDLVRGTLASWNLGINYKPAFFFLPSLSPKGSVSFCPIRDTSFRACVKVKRNTNERKNGCCVSRRESRFPAVMRWTQSIRFDSIMIGCVIDGLENEHVILAVLLLEVLTVFINQNAMIHLRVLFTIALVRCSCQILTP